MRRCILNTEGKEGFDPMSEQISFEQAVARLEEILKKLETGEAPLSESLSLFEEGVRLSGYCSSLLDGAEQRVTQLISKGGEVTESEFVPQDGDR